MPQGTEHFRGGRSLGVRMGYTFEDHDFGTGTNITQVIAIPTGMFGRVAGVLVYDITEDFVGGDSDSGVTVGDGTTAALYYDSALLVLDETVDALDSVWLPDTVSTTKEIPSDETALTITFVAATGAGITGIANVCLYIDWFDSTGYSGSSVA